MIIREDFYRREELGSEQRSMPAKIYNTSRLLLEHSQESCVFVPIRSMAYLAVIDHEEIIFVDAVAGRRQIEFSWQQFQPQLRSDLVSPVPYNFVYYDEKALSTVRQAQGEFTRFVQIKSDRLHSRKPMSGADIIGFPEQKTD